MKYQSSNSKHIYSIEFDTLRKALYKCPECSEGRRKSNSKDLEFYPESGRAYCFHCNTTFFEYKPFDKKEYVIPEWKNKTDLSDKAVKYFEGRMISQKTLIKMKIYSDIEWMPQFKKETEVICFPYFVNEKLVNIKFRGGNKTFKLNSGSQLVWYNFDAILNSKELIIVEGEIDLLSFVENGFDNVISVPNGAKNNDFIDETINLFDGKRIFIATDNDNAGIELRDELIRRMGAENCSIVGFKECKDANEYFCKYGGFDFKDLIKNSKQVQIDGNIEVGYFKDRLVDLFQYGLKPGAGCGIDEIDKYCTWETKRLAIVTGRPSSGKSEFVDYLICRLNLLYKWKAAYFTPENYPLEYHYSKLFEKLIGKPFKSSESSNIEFDIAYEYISQNFFYIMPENDLTVDKILSNARSYIKSKGIKILVMDPFNRLDHQIEKNQTETNYISKFLDKLTMFAKLNDLLIFLVAHPTKLEKSEIPSLYSISGSAHFYNKTDYGFTVHREFDSNNLMTSLIQVHWQKIKFKHLGEQGVSELIYNYNNGRFEKRQAIDYWDNSCWLIDNQDFFTNFKPEENAPF